MIPVTLQLTNFMAYKEPARLDFKDIHVACLTGANGAGKSTLLDAITWSLWGKARSKQDDELIHLHETEMEVEFSFKLGLELYRVLRRRTSVKRGKSELHFHISDAGGWRTLTENSIRLTQAKINRLLRLDYDTFINSAFLLQGRADEFTTHKPAERKQILADILGLGVYDDYEEKAAEKVRYYTQEIKIVESQIQHMQQEMTQAAVYRQELQQHQQQEADSHKAVTQAEEETNKLRQQHKELDLKERQRTDLQNRLTQDEKDLTDLKKTIAQVNTNISRYQTIITQKESIEAGYKQYQQAKTEQEDYQQRLAQSSTLNTQKHRLETEINQAKATLEKNRERKQTTLETLKPKVAQLSILQDNLTKKRTELATLNTLEAERDQEQQTLNNLNTETARLQEENKQLKSEMDKIKARLTQLEAAGSNCPICTQPLNETHRQAVKEQFVTEGTAKGDSYRANKTRLADIKKELKRLQQSITQAEKTLKKQSTLQAQIARIEHQLEEAEQAKKELNPLQKELTTLQTQLNEGQFALEAKTKLTELQTKLNNLGYDSKAHKAINEKTKSLTHFADDLRDLQDAETRLNEAKTRLEQETPRLERLNSRTESDQETIRQLNTDLKILPEIIKKLTTVNKELTNLQRQYRLARDSVVATKQKLEHLKYLAKEKTRKEDELADLKETQGVYKELRVAFGKKGVQALLIEHAIPELQDEANNMLGNMTDGRVNVQFITQRTGKVTDNLIETLDIRITDELGTRNYDLYSGGEAFRINFAIRIALSKLLARRAGASLQTLVIDEGFGTQDAQGREKLVEAIKTIQNEFEKIIVITHIEALKDAFPVRINIEKTEHGSQIKVI